MFRVQDTILSDEIATVKFACDTARCKGACCVVGDAGAPVSEDEVPLLKKAYDLLEDELRYAAREMVKKQNLVEKSNEGGYALNYTDNGECVFVQYTEQDVAVCAIQKAFYEARIDWEKPMSCHLFPVRLKHMGDFDYAHFDYVPSTCSPACEKGEKQGMYLSAFLEEPLVRRYGQQWYDDFLKACKEVRDSKQGVVDNA